MLHYLTKYLASPGKNDLTTSALELVAALLKIVRLTPQRASTSRKIWTALQLDGKILGRLLSTKRKIPLITKHGRKPDIRHLALSVLLTLMAPAASVSLKTDVLSTKGLVGAIWKSLHEDPREVVESTLECMAYLAGQEKLPLELRVRVAEDGWSEVLKLYARAQNEPVSDGNDSVSPATSAHRYLLYVTSAIGQPAPGSTSIAGPQKRALGTLLGMLQISDSEEQSDMAAHILQSTPEMLPSFWARFAPSLEPRLSSRWVTSVGFASRVIGGPVPNVLSEAYTQAQAYTAEQKRRGSAPTTGARRTRKPAIPSIGLVLDTALLPASIGRTWLSKALQTQGTTPLVSFLACNFLYIGLTKVQAISDALRCVGDALPGSEGKMWLSAAKRIRDEAKERIPDLQVLIALVQNGLGRAFSRANSVASTVTAEGSVEDGESVQEDNTLLISLTLRTIRKYHAIVPSVFSNLRFEFGRLLSSSFFSAPAEAEAAPLAALGQAGLLELLSSSGDGETGESAIVWQWSKSIEGGRSALASIVHIYLTTSISSLKMSAERAVRNLLGNSLLFEHDPDEVSAWLAALPSPLGDAADPDEVLAFVDGCIQRCLQAPFRYVDGLHALLSDSAPHCANAGCRSASPLLATLLEQLKYRFSKQESAVPYAGFTRRLIMQLATHRDCLCVSKALLEQAIADSKACTHQGAATDQLTRNQEVLQYMRGDRDDPGSTSPEGEASELVSLLLSVVNEKQIPAGLDVSIYYKLLRLLLHRIASRPIELEPFLPLINDLLDHSSAGTRSSVQLGVFGQRVLLAAARGLVEQKRTEALDQLCQLLLKYLDSTGTSTFAALFVERLPAEALVEMTSLPILLPVGSLVQALVLAASAKGRVKESAAAFTAALCSRLAAAVVEPHIASAVLADWPAFMRQGEAGQSVLAGAAARKLPPGVLVSQEGGRVADRPALDNIRAAAQGILKSSKAVSVHAFRVLAIAVYRFPDIYAAFVQSKLPASPFAQAAPALQAWLEIAIVKGQTIAVNPAVLTACIDTFLARNGQPELLCEMAGRVLLLVQRASPSSIATIMQQIEQKLPAAATADPAIFDRLSVETLMALSEQVASIETFALLELLVNESMKWLVRRFAEDAENTAQVSSFVRALGKMLCVPKAARS